MGFVWNGTELKSYSEIIDLVLKLPPEEQERFVEEYKKTDKYAAHNIGYMSGYYNQETASKIMEIFKTEHPLFGKRRPSAEEAYQTGLAYGEAAKNGGH